MRCKASSKNSGVTLYNRDCTCKPGRSTKKCSFIAVSVKRMDTTENKFSVRSRMFEWHVS